MAELARQAGVELSEATNRLLAAGLQVESPEMQVQQLAERYNRSAQQIYDIMAGLAQSRGKGHQGTISAPGGKGGGVGWKTLAQYYEEEKIALNDALQRLAKQKIQASPNQTLREIAVQNGFNRPSELLGTLRGTSPK